MLHRFINTVEADRIIPMPLHPVRLAGRGFNQSQEIARLLARHLKIPLDNSSCKRIKLAPPQASLPLKARISNMRGAFRYEQQLDGQRVLLIDDVMTTGASLNALAATVKAAGASHVECWVVARTQTKG
jgi:ComF family protein